MTHIAIDAWQERGQHPQQTGVAGWAAIHMRHIYTGRWKNYCARKKGLQQPICAQPTTCDLSCLHPAQKCILLVTAQPRLSPFLPPCCTMPADIHCLLKPRRNFAPGQQMFADSCADTFHKSAGASTTRAQQEWICIRNLMEASKERTWQASRSYSPGSGTGGSGVPRQSWGARGSQGQAQPHCPAVPLPPWPHPAASSHTPAVCATASNITFHGHCGCTLRRLAGPSLVSCSSTALHSPWLAHSSSYPADSLSTPWMRAPMTCCLPALIFAQSANVQARAILD